MILTSGTTGRSKGVVVPWGRCAGTLPVAEALDPDGNGTYYNPFPTFHWSARGPVYRAAARGTSLVTREGFKTSAWLDDVRRFGCTDTLLIGAMMGFLMASPPLPDDADNPIRACIGGPVPPFIEEFAARFGIDRVVATYGMSEIVNVFLTPPGTTVTAQTYQSCGKETESLFVWCVTRRARGGRRDRRAAGGRRQVCAQSRIPERPRCHSPGLDKGWLVQDR